MKQGETLPPITSGERALAREVTAQPHRTKPPARYTEATLLSAMEGAGKLVEDDELRAAMETKGLGTPATRAAIIEGLLREEYIHREGRELGANAEGVLAALCAAHARHRRARLA
jgi:DNA topoisomerase-3